jgi:L-threonylcarbamoyladenylate synthase
MAVIGTDLLVAQHLLQQGDVVAIPTETVYGLAANVYDEIAVSKIFTVKQRPLSNPLIVHIGSLDQVYQVISHLPAPAERLAKQYWPGPLTLLLSKQSGIPDLVTAGSTKVAVRIPNHPLTLQLLQHLDFPLAAPSANPFGYISPTTPEHVQEQLGNQIPYILAGGKCTVGIESTIVGFENEKTIIYRLGGISVESIEQIMGPVTIHKPAKHLLQSIVSPGNFAQHYSPTKPLKIGSIPALLARYGHQQIGILAFDRYYEGISQQQQVLLTPSGSLQEAAHNLFTALRQLDQLPIDMILSAYVPDTGLGKAINDRLQRASAHST